MKLWKVFYAIILALFFLPAGHEVHAAQAVMPDTMAMEMARKSFVMHDENGKIYSVYIIGDNEMFVGAKHFTWLYGRDTDQVYKAYPYNAYLSAPGKKSAEIQYVQLFGKKMDVTRPDFINVTAPTYIWWSLCDPGRRWTAGYAGNNEADVFQLCGLSFLYY